MPSSESAADLPSEDLEDLYENAPCGYISLTPEGRIAKSNDTLSIWLGVPKAELQGKKFHALLNVASRVFYETHFAPLLRIQGFFNEVALDFIDKSVEKIPVLVNAAERRDESGKLIFTRVTVFKATDRRLYERQLVEAHASAVESLAKEREIAELREQFVAVLGHDLRNPLAGIVGGIRFLQKEHLSARGEQIIEMLAGSTQRMSSLIDDVMDFARGRLGSGLDMKIEPGQDLTPVLEQVVAELREAMPDAAIECKFALPRSVTCDRMRLAQLASNLLGNALTHGHVGQPMRFFASSEGDEFVLWIANPGDPIPTETLSRLFQPFFRAGPSSLYRGLGLGLYICAEIAKAHGGTLAVDSSVIETRFTFRMPLEPAPSHSVDTIEPA